MSGSVDSAAAGQVRPVGEETPDSDGAYPRLTADQVRRLGAIGERRRVDAGDVLFEAGQQVDEFFVVLDGLAAVVETDDGTERVVRRHGPGRFLGDITTLEGQPVPFTTRMDTDGEVLAVPVKQLRDLTLSDPSLGETILRAYLIRRTRLIERGTGLRIIGSCYSPDTHRLLEFAARNRVPHRLVDLERDPQAGTFLRRFGVPTSDTPIVVLHGREVLRNPSNADLARRLGLNPAVPSGDVVDLVVVGAGPAGLGAAVYGASDGLDTILVDAVATGGQAGTSSRIENYLGFPAGVSGAELAERAVMQAEKFGARLSLPVGATSLEPGHGTHAVAFGDGSTVEARAVVLATGVRYRRLEVPGIEKYEATSVYYAATVHEANACGSDAVVIVGGGNSAGQAAVFLARTTARVYLVALNEDLSEYMSRYLIDEVVQHERIEVLVNSRVCGLEGEHTLEAVVVEDLHNGERRHLEVKAMFVFIGATATTAWLDGTLELDDKGYVLTGHQLSAPSAESWSGLDRAPMMLETSEPAVFAAGDVRSGSVKRVASAVGEGAICVRHVHEALADGLHTWARANA